MRTVLSLIEGPEAEPLTLDEVKAQIRLTSDQTRDDDELTRRIKSARLYVERVTGRQLIEATYQVTLSGWPCGAIELPRPPLQEVNEITYLDAAGDEQTWDEDSYVVEAPAGPSAGRGRITRAPTISWPTVQCGHAGPITVEFVSGYGAAEDVPADLKDAMLMLIASWYSNREAVLVGVTSKAVEFSLSAMLSGYRSRPELQVA